MSTIGSENKATLKSLEKKEKMIFSQLENPGADESEIIIDESGKLSTFN